MARLGHGVLLSCLLFATTSLAWAGSPRPSPSEQVYVYVSGLG